MSTDSINGSRISPYYDSFRSDIIHIVPTTAKCVLSVGCAAGRTEAELVKRGIKVVGVEINHEAATIARQRGLTILEGDASEVDISQVSDSFDCLIYPDILEHLPDPVAVLRRHVESLQTKGTVIVSVPNFRHYSVFWQLFVLGHIQYKNAGILDRTHLRITTRKMIVEWFDKVRIKPIFWNYHINRRRVKLISMVSFGLLKEFLGSQILVVGKKL